MNLIAAVLTLVAMAVAVTLVHPSYRLATALIVWGICHVIWGSYLAWQLPPISPDKLSTDTRRD